MLKEQWLSKCQKGHSDAIVLCCFKYHTDSCLVQSAQQGKGCMGEEVYSLPSLVCCAGGLVGKLPGEDSGVLAVRSAILCIDPGKDRMDVVLVSLCVHKMCQPCLFLCIWICPSLHCCRKRTQKKRLCLVSFVGETRVMLGFPVGLHCCIKKGLLKMGTQACQGP